MRYIYITLIVLVTAAVVVFKVQNVASTTVTFLNISMTLPVALLVVAAYLLGMVTGSAFLSLLRGWIQGARRTPRQAPS